MTQFLHLGFILTLDQQAHFTVGAHLYPHDPALTCRIIFPDQYDIAGIDMPYGQNSCPYQTAPGDNKCCLCSECGRHISVSPAALYMTEMPGSKLYETLKAAAMAG